MAGVNKVIVLGHLGQDPETRYTQSGDAISNISLATSETFKDRDGNKQERTEWHRIVFFRRLAEIVAEYCHKGSQVYVEGKLQTRKWADKEGIDRYTTEIVADRLQLLGSKGDNSGNGGSQRSNGSSNNRPQNSAPRQSPQSSAPSNTSDPFSGDDFDDDIPF